MLILKDPYAYERYTLLSPCSVRMPENTDQKNYGHFLRSDIFYFILKKVLLFFAAALLFGPFLSYLLLYSTTLYATLSFLLKNLNFYTSAYSVVSFLYTCLAVLRIW